jgi:YggT family protein
LAKGRGEHLLPGEKMIIVIRIVNFLISLLVFVVIVNSFLTFLLSPYHPIRLTLAKIVEPLLNPIRRIIPSTGGIDLSPLILIILLQILGAVVVALLRSIF